LTTNKSELRTPYQINSTYYIEANIDNNSKFRKLKSLLTKLNFEDDLLINFSAKDYDSLEEEKMNRIYWEDKVGADVMKNLDKVLDSLHKIDENLKFNYTIGYIGFVVKNKVDNFLVLNPKSEWVRFSVKVKNVEHWHNVLIENGIDVISIGVNSKRLKFRIKNNSISDQMGKILDLLFESYNNR
jgi:hypothetical protein